MITNEDHSSQSDSEQFCDVGRGITLCYETLGDPTATPIMLINGWGQQLIDWPEPFCDQLVAGGHFLVRFDNRDSGRSSRAPMRPPTPLQLATRRFAADQYTIADMTRDTIGLLDALELDSVHVVGVSMGGMIAQTLAAQRPERVRSLVSIMSTTGARKVGRPAPSTRRLFIGRRPSTEAAAVDRYVKVWRHIASPGFPFDEAAVRAQARRVFRRGYDPAGTMRQLGAIIKSGDRTAELGRIAAPTLVVHGDRDRLIDPSGGRATARAIAGARLELIGGMGHDLPAGAIDRLARLILDHVERADAGARARVVGGG